MGNHVVELVLPALLLFPHRYARCLGGLAQIAFQVRKSCYPVTMIRHACIYQ
jgi:hypothetical protein